MSDAIKTNQPRQVAVSATPAKRISQEIKPKLTDSALSASSDPSATLTVSEIGKLLAASLPSNTEKSGDEPAAQLEKDLSNMLKQYKQISTYK